MSASEVRLSNLVVKPEVFDTLQLPIRVKYGRVGSVVVYVPGGVLSWYFNQQPIRVVISDVHVLIDKDVSTPLETARKLERAKAEALELDALLYRQEVLDQLQAALQQALPSLGTGGKQATTAVKKGLLESVLSSLIVEINNVHVRYEDTTSSPGAPFAGGVTVASFSSSLESATTTYPASMGDASSTSALDPAVAASDALATSTAPPPPASGTGTPLGAFEKRTAKLSLFSAYWDPLELDGAFAALPPGPGLTAAFARGIMTRDVNASHHWYILLPTSPRVDVTRRVRHDAAAPAAAAFSASLEISQLELSLSRGQMRQASYLSSWVADQSWLQLRQRLRPPQGMPSVGAPKSAWKAVWRYACDVILELRKRQPQSGGFPRWDRGRIRGSVEARRQYIAAYAELLGKEADVLAVGLQQQLRAGGGSGGDAATMDTAAALSKDRSAAPLIASIAKLEASLLYEQLIDYRLEARLAAEEARSRKHGVGTTTPGSAKSGTTRSKGWAGWFSGGATPTVASPSASGPAVAAPQTPAAARFDESKRRSELLRVALAATAGEAVRLQLSAGLRVCRVSLLAGTVCSQKAADNGVDARGSRSCSREPKLATLQFGGSVECAVRTNGRWAVSASMTSFCADDEVTQGTGFKRIVGPPASSPAITDDMRTLPPFLVCSIEQVVFEAPAPSAPPAQPSNASRFSHAQSRLATRVIVTSQPLDIVIAPAVLRGLATFASIPGAAQLSSSVASELSALSSRTPADFYALLAQRAAVDVTARLAAPTFILPDDVSDPHSGRLVVRLGNLSLRSLPDDVAPILLPPEWPPRFKPTLFEHDSGVALESAKTVASNVGRPVLTDTDAHFAFDSWVMELSDVAIDAVAPLSSTAATLSVTPVLHPVSLALQLQASFLPLALDPENPEALRLRGSVSRVAAVSSLALAQRMVQLQRTGLALLKAISTDALAIAQDVAAAPGAASLSMGFSPPRGGEAASNATPAPAPASVFVDFSVGEMSLSVLNVRHVVQSLASVRGRLHSSPLDRRTDFSAWVAATLKSELPPATGQSEFMLLFAGLRATAALSQEKAHVDIHLRSVVVIDRFQSAGAEFERFVDSNPRELSHSTYLSPTAFPLSPSAYPISTAVEDDGGPLVRVTAEMTTVGGSSSPRLRAAVEANSLQVGYNPETIAALQWYARFLLSCVSVGWTGELADSTSVASDLSSLPPSVPATTVASSTPLRVRRTSASVATASPLSTPQSQAAPSAISYVGQIQRMLSPPSTHTPVFTSDSRPVVSSPCAGDESIQFVATASVTSLGVTFHKERQRLKLAHVVVANLIVAARSTLDAGPGIEIEVSLGDAALYPNGSRDVPRGSTYPYLIAVGTVAGTSDASDRSGHSPALRACFQTWDDPGHLRFPGYDSAVTLRIPILTCAYLHQPVLELVDYVQQGILGSLLAATATRASAAVISNRDSRMLLDVQIISSRIVLPADARKLGALVVSVGAIVLRSSYCEPPVSDGGVDVWAALRRDCSSHAGRALNKIALTMESLALCARTDEVATEQLVVDLQGGAVDVHVPCGAALLDNTELPSFDVTIVLPSTSISISALQLTGMLAIVMNNLSAEGAKPDSPRAVDVDTESLSELAAGKSQSVQTSSTLWLGVVYAYGAPSLARASTAKAARARVLLPDSVTVFLRPESPLDAPSVVFAVRRVMLAVTVGFPTGSAIIDADFSELSVQVQEPGIEGSAFMLRPIRDEPVDTMPLERNKGVKGVCGISAGILTRSKSQHLAVRATLGAGDSAAADVEVVLRHTEVFPSLAGLASLLAFYDALIRAYDTLVMSASSDPAWRTLVAPEASPQALPGPLEPAASTGAAASPGTGSKSANSAVSTVRILISGVSVLMSPDKKGDSTKMPLLAVTLGAEAALELADAAHSATPLFKLQAAAELGASLRQGAMPPERVLRNVCICADVAASNASRSAQLSMGLVHITLCPRLLRTLSAWARSISDANLHFSLQSRRGVEPSGPERRVVTTTGDLRNTDINEDYSLHWDGLVTCVSRCDDAALDTAGASHPLLELQIDGVKVAVSSRDQRRSCGATGSFSVTAATWVPLSRGSEAHWEPLLVRPWVFEAIVRTAASESADPAPRTLVDVSTASPLCLVVCDTRLQELLSQADSWKAELLSGLSAVTINIPALPPQDRFVPVEPLVHSLCDAAVLRRSEVLTLRLRAPYVSAALVQKQSTGQPLPLVNVIIAEVQVEFVASEFLVATTGEPTSTGNVVSGTCASLYVSEAHVVDQLSPAARFLLTSTPTSSAAAVHEQYLVATRGIVGSIEARSPHVSSVWTAAADASDAAADESMHTVPLAWQAGYVAQNTVRATRLVSVEFAAAEPPNTAAMHTMLSRTSYPQHLVTLAAASPSFDDAPACTHVVCDTVHVEASADILAALLRFAIVVTSSPGTPSKSGDFSAGQAPALLAAMPPASTVSSRKPASCRRGFCLGLHLGKASVALLSQAQRRCLARAELHRASIIVAMFSPSCVGLQDERLAVRGKLGRLSVHDALVTSPAAAAFADMLSPISSANQHPGTCSNDNGEDTAEFAFDSFGHSVDVPACTVLSARLNPLRVVYISRHVQNIISVVSDELLVLLGSSSEASKRPRIFATHDSPAAVLQSFVAAKCPLPPSAIVSISLQLCRTQLLLPAYCDETDWGGAAPTVVLEFSNAIVATKSYVLDLHDAIKVIGAAPIDSAAIPAGGALRLPVSDMSVIISGLRVGAKDSGDARLESVVRLQTDDKGTSVSARLCQPIPVPAWDAVGCTETHNVAISLSVPLVDVSMTPQQLCTIRRVIDGNIAAPPLSAQDQSLLCSKTAAYLPEVPVTARPCCSRCGRTFGGMVTALHCDLCGDSVCVVCLANFRDLRVFDVEAGIAKQSCAECWPDLVMRNTTVITTASLASGADVPTAAFWRASNPPTLGSPVRSTGFSLHLDFAGVTLTLLQRVPHNALPLALAEMIGARLVFTSGTGGGGRTSAKATVSTLVVSDARASPAGADTRTKAARTIFAPNWRELQRARTSGGVSRQIPETVGVLRQRSLSDTRMSPAIDQSATQAPTLADTLEDQMHQIVVSFVSSVPLQKNRPVETKLQVLFNHCDVQPDPEMLFALADFADGYSPPEIGQLAAAPSAMAAEVFHGALPLQKRVPLNDFTLFVSLHSPRVVLLEHAHRLTSRVLLLSFAEMAHVTVRSAVDAPSWRLVAAPSSLAVSNTAPILIARCRSQASRSTATIAVSSAELLVSHLLPPVSDRLGICISSDRVSIIRPFSIDLFLQCSSTSLLSLGCNPSSWEREHAASNLRVLSADPDARFAVASTLDPAVSTYAISVELSPIRAILAYSDGLLLSRVVARMSRAQVGTTLKPSAAVVSDGQALSDDLPRTPMSSRSPFLSFPQSWHACDYEVRVPPGLELGLTVLALAHASLAPVASSNSSAATASAEVLLEPAEQVLPPQYIEHLRNRGISAETSVAPPTSYDCGEGVRLYTTAAVESLSGMRSGDVLLSVNGQSVGGLTREDTVRVIQRARAAGPILLRLRSMPLAISVKMHGLHVTVINDSGGLDDPLLDAQVVEARALLRSSVGVPLRHRGRSKVPDDGSVPPPATESAYLAAWVESAAISFFNSRIAKWEPMLEPLQVTCTAAALDDALAESPIVQKSTAASAAQRSSFDVDWVDVPLPAGRPSAYARSVSGRPRRVISLRVSPAELVVSHAMVSKLSAAFTGMQAAASRDNASLQSNTVSASASTPVTPVADWDLALATENAAPLSAPVPDTLVLQVRSLHVPVEAFPVQFHNATGVAVVLCVVRDDPSTGSLHSAILFSRVSVEDGSSFGSGTGGSRDDSAAADSLRSAAAASGNGHNATILVPPGGRVGLTTARDRDALGIVTTRRSLVVAPASVALAASVESSSLVRPSDPSFPTIQVFAGIGTRGPICSLTLELPSEKPVSAWLRHTDKAPASIVAQVAAPAAGRRTVSLRSCTVFHNTCGVDFELLVWPQQATAAEVGLRPVRLGVIRARASFDVPASLPAEELSVGLRLRPLPFGDSVASEVGAYGLSGPLHMGSTLVSASGSDDSAFELLCPPATLPSSSGVSSSSNKKMEADGAFSGLPPYYVAVVVRRSAAGAAALTSVVLAAPLVLTNALPVPLTFAVSASSGGNGDRSEKKLVGNAENGMLQPGEVREVYSVSGGRTTGRLIRATGGVDPAATKQEPAAAIKIPSTGESRWFSLTQGLNTPVQAGSAGRKASPSPGAITTLDVVLQPSEAGLATPPSREPPPLVLRAEVRAVPAWVDIGATAEAGGTGRIVVSIFADAWLVNRTGLPMLVGQQRAGYEDDEPGVEGTIEPCGHQLVRAAPPVAAASASQQRQPPAPPLELVVCDECYENERFDHFSKWRPAWLMGDPPAFSDGTGEQQLSREDIEARLPRGWVWSGPWQAGPWDHTAAFPNFSTTKHGFNPEKREKDWVRRRRHFRLRVRQRPQVAGADASAAPESVAAARPGIAPGCYAVAPATQRWSASNRGDLRATPKIVGGAPLDALDAGSTVALFSFRSGSAVGADGGTTSSSRTSSSAATAAAAASDAAYVRVLSSCWSAGIDARTVGRTQTLAIDGPEEEAFEAGGAAGGGGSGGKAAGVAMFRPSLCFDVVVNVALGSGPFFRSRVASLHPRITLVNATGGALVWRQAGRAPGSVLPTVLPGTYPEHSLAPYSATPLWLDAPEPAAVMLSPAAALGGWSPPLSLLLPDTVSALHVPLAVVLGGQGLPWVRSCLGATPTGVVCLGVTLKTDRDVPGALVLVAAMQSPPGAALRPPDEVLRGSDAERMTVAAACARDIDECLAAAASAKVAAAAHADGSSKLGAPAVPLVAATALPTPFITIVNYSRFTLAYRQRGSEASRYGYSPYGEPYSAVEFDDAGRQLAQLLALPSKPALTGSGGEDAPLGVLLAQGFFFAPAHSVTPVGLVDPAAAVEERGGAAFLVAIVDASAAAAGGGAAGPKGVLRLQRIGRCLVLHAPQATPARNISGSSRPLGGSSDFVHVEKGDAAARGSSPQAPSATASSPDCVVVRVLLRGHERRVVVHDASTVGADLMRLLATVAPPPPKLPGGAVGVSEDFELSVNALERCGTRVAELLQLGRVVRPPPIGAIAEAAGEALVAADAAPWLGAPGLDHSRVFVPPDEPAWSASTAAAVMRFSLAGRSVDAAAEAEASVAALLDALPASAPPAAAAGSKVGSSGKGQQPGEPLAVLPPSQAAAWDTTATLQLGGVGVSVIDDTPREALYVRAARVAVALLQTATMNSTTVRIDDVSVDDPSRDAEFPVLCGRTVKAGGGGSVAAPAAGPPGVSAPPVAAPRRGPMFRSEFVTARDTSFLASLAAAGTSRDRGVRVLRAALDVAPLRLCVSARYVFYLIRVTEGLSAAAAAPKTAVSSQRGPSRALHNAVDFPTGAMPPHGDAAAAAASTALHAELGPRGAVPAALLQAARAVQQVTGASAGSRDPRAPTPAALAACAILSGAVRSRGGGGGGPLETLMYVQALRVGRLSLLADLRLSPKSGIERHVSPTAALLIEMASGAPVTGAALAFELPAVEHAVVTGSDLIALLTAPLAKQAARQWMAVVAAIGGIGAPLALMHAVAAGADRARSGAKSGGVEGALQGVAGAASNSVAAVVGATAGLTGLISGAAGAVSAAGGPAPGVGGGSAKAGGGSGAGASRPSGITDGASQAAEQFFGGFVGGVTGLFSKTARGFEKGTVVGAAQGLASGMAGLVASPIAGIAGAATSILQGVEQELRTDDVKANDAGKLHRARPPRPLYGFEGAVRVYSLGDAQAMESVAALLDPPGDSGREGGSGEERLLRADTLQNHAVLVLTSSRVLELVGGACAWRASLAGASASVIGTDARGTTVLLRSPHVGGGGSGSRQVTFASAAVASRAAEEINKAAATLAVEAAGWGFLQ